MLLLRDLSCLVTEQLTGCLRTVHFLREQRNFIRCTSTAFARYCGNIFFRCVGPVHIRLSEIASRFRVPQLFKSADFRLSYSQKTKGGRFWRHGV